MGIDLYRNATDDLPLLDMISDDKPGYTRLPWGRGFTYRCWEGKTVKDSILLSRFKALVLPPAWQDVWITPAENGYLQATGRDEKGRKQYRYHHAWTTYQQALKFRRMTSFVEALVPARIEIANILADRSEGWPHRRAAALAIAVLDETGMRIGNKDYYRRNGTTGLTTIRRKHMEVDNDALHFDYVGKSSKDRSVEIDDPELVELIKNMADQPGYEVFRYRGKDSRMHNLDSGDVNRMIRELVGDDHSAKSFRTWAGTAAAIEFYPAAKKEIADNPKRRIDTCLVDLVAEFLGNTPTICREYYIHPLVLAAIEKQEVPSYQEAAAGLSPDFLMVLDESEIVAYHLLRQG